MLLSMMKPRGRYRHARLAHTIAHVGPSTRARLPRQVEEHRMPSARSGDDSRQLTAAISLHRFSSRLPATQTSPPSATFDTRRLRLPWPFSSFVAADIFLYRHHTHFLSARDNTFAAIVISSPPRRPCRLRRLPSSKIGRRPLGDDILAFLFCRHIISGRQAASLASFAFR